ncbi:hypothetical protein QJS04_geneDACA001606 [Acorus gramineus]|uniref:RING-type domain-containing protein n=1 Tax=Acorus gramineus TaxID=55184 RepID=A0AAV9BIV7_ACOGR|nr:hypothetical protein QJS04_geneDACA001606 [Acorus gramineus]
MVVCKCRKATKLYCFVHEVAVCGECICHPEHQICVVRSYAEWVIDGSYVWPSTCCLCQAALEDQSHSPMTRLGCLHLIHTNCLVSHIQSYPPQTAPTGYACPSCSSPIWPPKNIKDPGSLLHSKLKEAIIQSGLEKNLFGNHLVSLPVAESRVPPPAFASDPLIHISATEDEKINTTFESIEESKLPSSSVDKERAYSTDAYSSRIQLSEPDIVEIEGPSSLGNQFTNDHDHNFLKSPGATTRKGAYYVDRQNSEMSYYADDEDGNKKKYTKRGPFRHKLLRLLLPFWSSALPTLPVTAPPRKDGAFAEDVPESRLRHRSSRMDPRKILLTMAIMACMATMGILYYRLAQRSLGESLPDDEQQ